MLSERQKTEMNMLIERYSRAEILTSSAIAHELGVTTRTVHNDIKSLNVELYDLNANIITVSGKGYRLQVLDEESMVKCMELLSDEIGSRDMFQSREERIKYIIGLLLFSRKPVLSDLIAYQTYVSRSQFSIDIKEVKEVLNNYSLEVRTRAKAGICIEGKEEDKRLCLVKEKLNCHRYSKDKRALLSRKELGELTIDVLSHQKYEISDLDLQNLLIYLETAVWRIRENFLLENYEAKVQDMEGTIEWRLAERIYEKLRDKFALRVNTHEIAYLTVILTSIRAMQKDEVITDETAEIISIMMKTIKRQFNFDFENNIELRVNLSMHIIPMIVRARNNLLSSNPLLAYIKQSLPLAYDIAVVARHDLEKFYRCELNEEEAGYLAIHFAMGLNSTEVKKYARRVLIITSSRRSDELLLRYNVLKNFNEFIYSLDICQVNQMEEVNVANYDVIFSTLSELNITNLSQKVIHIDYFLSIKDRMVMEAALKENVDRKAPGYFFRRELFFVNPSVKNREELLRFMCDQLNSQYHYDNDLYPLVLEREDLGTTAFTNSVALPHPVCPFSTETVACVVILDESIPWGNEEASVIFLMNIRVDGEREMEQLYDFLSTFIQSKPMIKKLKDSPNYDTLLRIMNSFEGGEQ